MADAFDALLDRLADQLADRVMARLDARLTSPSAAAAEPDAYRVGEAAQRLGISAHEVRRRLAAGELRSVRVGRVVLIPRSALLEFLERRSLRSVA